MHIFYNIRENLMHCCIKIPSNALMSFWQSFNITSVLYRDLPDLLAPLDSLVLLVLR